MDAGEEVRHSSTVLPSSPGTPCSGTANNYGNGEINCAHPDRIMQLGLKFIF